jgi:peptidoglycan/LPS O-acetylase OafA/YrhL
MPGVNGATAFLGRVSYSIYLLHGLVIVMMGGVFRSIYAFGLPDSLSFLLACALALTVIVPVSWITYSLIEEPGNAIARKIVKRLGRREDQYPYAI